MNKHLPYEEEIQQQLSNIPLPPEDFAWQEMKKLLDEDDDGGAAALPPKPGCSLWLLLALLLVSIGFYFAKPWQWFAQKNKKETVANVQEKSKASNSILKNDTITVTANNLKLVTDSVSITTTNEINVNENDTGKSKLTPKAIADKKYSTNTINGNDSKTAVPILKKKGAVNINVVNGVDENSKPLVTGNDKNQEKTDKLKRYTKSKTKAINTGAVVQDNDDKVNADGDKDSFNIQQQTATNTITQTLKKDSLAVNKTPVPLPQKDSASTEKEPAKETKQPKFYYSFGIAVQLAIPVAGQSIVPYNNYGRRGALTDYIPSVYFRMHKENKWFLQSEFRYGVPQYTKEFTYSKKITVDTIAEPDLITTGLFSVRKTYYHQLPLSFNYYVLPELAVGTGFSFSRFSSAVVRVNTFRRLAGAANDSLISSEIKSVKNDSAFKKNNFQWLFEAQYKWKRFFFGARFAIDVKPSINYTDPVTGIATGKRNSSLNIFARYELWNSKKKK